MSVTKASLAKKMISQGLELAKRMRATTTRAEIEAMYPDLRVYADEFDAYFAEVDPDGYMGDSSLTTSLFVAYDWHKQRLTEPRDPARDFLAETFTRDFETELTSKYWVDGFHDPVTEQNPMWSKD